MSKWAGFRFLLISKARDAVNQYLMPFISIAYFLAHYLAAPRPSLSMKLLLASRRAYRFSLIDGCIKRLLYKLVDNNLSDEVGKRLSIGRFIVLKMPIIKDANAGAIEKGVILIKFTETFLPFLHALNMAEISKYFRFVLEPSWTGYAIESIVSWAVQDCGRVIVCCPEKDDYEFIRGLDSNLIPVRFGASDWVDERVFSPGDRPAKTYDSIYVANYNSIKRLHRYFEAISNIRIAGYKCATVCSSWGRSRSELLSLVRLYGISDKLDIYEDLSQAEINVLLNKSKVNMLLSWREGANKSIFEGFFAGTPAIVLRDNKGVNKDYINQYTGHLIQDRDLELELEWFYENWHSFDSDRWARENISPRVTSEKLNLVLKQIASAEGEQWSIDILPKVNSPELEYYSAKAQGLKDAMNAELVKVFARGSRHELSLPSLLAWSDKWSALVGFDRAIRSGT